MSDRRLLEFETALSDALADARGELVPEQFEAYLEHAVGVVAAAWAAWVATSERRTA